MKKIRLTETQLHGLIKECVTKLIKEQQYGPYDGLECQDEDDIDVPEGYNEEMEQLSFKAEEAGVSEKDPRFRREVDKLKRKYGLPVTHF